MSRGADWVRSIWINCVAGNARVVIITSRADDATTSTMSQTRFITHLQKEPLKKPAAMVVI
jgi:hypothetical protein